jgi:hypothetical protein
MINMCAHIDEIIMRPPTSHKRFYISIISAIINIISSKTD